MKRPLFAVLAAVVAFTAVVMSLDELREQIVQPPALHLLLAASLLSLALWLSRVGASSSESAGSRRLSVALGVICCLALVAGTVLVQQRSAPLTEDKLTERFNELYYSRNLFFSSYLGVSCLQYPTDQWVMQELISEIKPDFIVETGTFSGATTLFYSQVLSQVNPDGRILTVDIAPMGPQAQSLPAWDERIEFILGDSVGEHTLDRIREQVEGHTVLVTLDSLHTAAHVAQELELYAPLVSPGSYIVVQDTHLGGNPNHHPTQDGDPGPMRAVLDFLAEHPEFQADRGREKHMLTQNPSGYLKRVG